MLTRSVSTLLTVVVLVLALGLPERMVDAQANPRQSVINLTNDERQKAGRPPLTSHPSLMQAAQSYAEVLASGDCFDHTCGPVPDLRDRVEQAGYTSWIALGENIAAGAKTPEAVMNVWMNSAGHRDNILNPNYKEIGVGVASGGRYGMYWVQVFGARSGTDASFKVWLPLISRQARG